MKRMQWEIALEWKPQDMWIGAYWKTAENRLDIWICLLPMLPIHLSWWENPRPVMIEQGTLQKVEGKKSDIVQWIDTRPQSNQSRFF